MAYIDEGSKSEQTPLDKKKSLGDGASLRERMVLTNVKNYSKLGENNLFYAYIPPLVCPSKPR